MPKIKVVLVDDHTVLRQGLRALLSYSEDIDVVGEAQNGREAIEVVERLRPDVVLMDINMPIMNGIDATRAISERFPDTRVVVLTQYEEQQYIVPLLEANASGFITKRAEGSEIIGAIRTVAGGEVYVHPVMATLMARQIKEQSQAATARASLTPRERDVLKLVVRGHTNGQIARELELSVKTVEWHRANVMNKLGAHGVADLVRHALQHGLISEDEAQG